PLRTLLDVPHRPSRSSSRSRLCHLIFHDTAPTEIYTLSLHDALPILGAVRGRGARARQPPTSSRRPEFATRRVSRETNRRCFSGDRKSTRLNSSHVKISYAVFCLKKKRKA